ncbi:MAG TPA: TonB family protein [Steroidobacteraceae bacterium]
MIAIVLLQIAVVYVFESGLATRVIHMAEPPLETTIVQDVKQRDLPPPPPPPKMERPPIEVPPPDVVINLPQEPTSTAITNVTSKPVRAPPPAPRAAVIVPAQLDIKHSPSAQDYYPPTSIRMNESGSAVIKLCAASDGSVAGTPTLVKSSGSPRLDEAAIKWGIHVRMHPETSDGKPIGGCVPLKVTFVLQG